MDQFEAGNQQADENQNSKHCPDTNHSIYRGCLQQAAHALIIFRRINQFGKLRYNLAGGIIYIDHILHLSFGEGNRKGNRIAAVRQEHHRCAVQIHIPYFAEFMLRINQDIKVINAVFGSHFLIHGLLDIQLFQGY